VHPRHANVLHELPAPTGAAHRCNAAAGDEQQERNEVV
jgi:hypothetical protein